MRVALLAFTLLAFTPRNSFAEDSMQSVALSSACREVNLKVLDYVDNGRLQDAEFALLKGMALPANSSEPACYASILYNMAAVLSLAGRTPEAEVYARRCIAVLDKNYPPDHPILLRPLHSLATALFEQQKIGKARAVHQRVLSIPAVRPDDRAKVHTMAAALLAAESRYKEAEVEYLKAVAIREQFVSGEYADMAALLNMLGNLYIVDKRFEEADRVLDRALAILRHAKDTVPKDLVKLLSSQAAVHIGKREWRKAEEELQSAISIADSRMQLSPSEEATLLLNYAIVLRKCHRRREAREIDERAASARSRGRTVGVVDASELLSRSRSKR